MTPKTPKPPEPPSPPKAPVTEAKSNASSKLPILMAGPIIRRAEQTGVWIWIATSEEVTEVQPYLLTYNIYGSSASRSVIDLANPVPPDSFRCVRLGEKLWVSLFRMAPKKSTLPTNVILGYDFAIITTSGLRWLEELVEDKKRDLCYEPFPDPTFFLQNRAGKLAQASCRRPGAYGQDAFGEFDEYLKFHNADLSMRPAALFLGGDQIYADDVAYALFQSIRTLAPDIMGYDELLPGVGNWDGLTVASLIKYTLNDNDKETRKPVVLQAGFTTDDGEGHLMTFGEFAAMYLLVWNPVLCARYEVEKDHRVDPIGTKNLINFTQHVAQARRVLANIPTYMIFDDHEITDDWNLDDEWVDGTNNALARRILTNGLAAGWCFQAWGNVPEMRGQSACAKTTDLIEKRLAAELKSPEVTDESFEKELLDREPYAFVAPTQPPVIVTDLRTHRQFDPARVNKSSLLNQKGYAHLTNICKGLPVNKPVVILCATPLLPWSPVMVLRADSFNSDLFWDSIGDARQAPMKMKSKYEFGDMWLDHPQGRTDFVQWIYNTFKPPYCVVFAGDVHHGFMIKGKARMYASEENQLRELWSLDIINITSSPIKNEHGQLRDTKVGIPVADILDSAFPTNGSDYSHSTDYFSPPRLKIDFEAVELIGPLTLYYKVLKFAFSTVVFQNHICIVDFSDSHQIVAMYYGNRASALGVVRV